MLMDGTFGTNKWKFALTTIMVVNDQNHGVPVAFFVHSSQSADTIKRCLEALANRLGEDFRPSVMVIDDAAAEIAAVRESVWYEVCSAWSPLGSPPFGCVCAHPLGVHSEGRVAGGVRLAGHDALGASRGLRWHDGSRWDGRGLGANGGFWHRTASQGPGKHQGVLVRVARQARVAEESAHEGEQLLGPTRSDEGGVGRARLHRAGGGQAEVRGAPAAMGACPSGGPPHCEHHTHAQCCSRRSPPSAARVQNNADLQQWRARGHRRKRSRHSCSTCGTTGRRSCRCG